MSLSFVLSNKTSTNVILFNQKKFELPFFSSQGINFIKNIRSFLLENLYLCVQFLSCKTHFVLIFVIFRLQNFVRISFFIQQIFHGRTGLRPHEIHET